MDNYVNRLGHLFLALRDYQSEVLHGKDLETFQPSDWESFGKWLTARIRREPIAARTQTKGILTSNKLLAILAQHGTIPIRIELDALEVRKQAKDGESIYTQKGYNQKPKVVTPLSPFAFRKDDHKRAYDYTEFQPLARRFLLTVIPYLDIYYGRFSKGTAKQLHGTVSKFLQFLTATKEQGLEATFFSQLASDNPEQISANQWESMVYQWREALTGSPERNIRTNNTHVKRFSNLWFYLADTQLVPHISVQGYKNAKAKGTTKPRETLAQLVPVVDVPNKTENAVWKRLQKYFGQTDQEEARQYIRALCARVGNIKELTIDQIIEKIHELNTERLNALRLCAEADFLHWYQHWQHGQSCLASVQESQSPEELLDLLNSSQLSISQRRKNSTRLLFSGGNDTRLGNAMQYVEATQEGISSGIHGRYHHLMRSFGDRFTFHAYLHPHPHATLALWVLIMVDTAANCEVAREIPSDCLKQTKPGTSKITLGTKARGGKGILDELPDEPAEGQRLSLPQAIRHYQEMVARYRKLAIAGHQDRLLLHEYMSIVHGLEEWTARSWFQEFLGRYEVLNDLDATPAMIRPSALMSVQHQNSDNLSAAQAIADHSQSSTTLRHYTGRAPLTLKYNLLLREFTERYQAVMIVTIKGAAEKLGLTEEEFKRILSDAHRTGLGVACLDPYAGIQPGTSPGSRCTRLEECHGCKGRYVVATVDNVVDLILFNKHLQASEAEQIARNPDRWERRWLPWLVFSDIALAKLSQGETAKTFADAQELAAAKKDTYVPFPLD
ncbi:hypothetical protein [Ralstonia pseudosolanacearum]|uniref:hypothetical protein n=1 Tax=Ralstonia pseudosolanacearum TaxID=1310165 RepID=UPI002005DBBB|nr:hypothetical protein [Ralstonia pseudosolanacearum]